MSETLLKNQVRNYFGEIDPASYSSFLKEIRESYDRYEAEIARLKEVINTPANEVDNGKLIMNAAFDAIICIDIQESITFWNPQAEKIFGWKEEEVKGTVLCDSIIPERYREHHKRGMKAFLQTGKGSMVNRLVEISALRKDGTEFPIELSIITIEQRDSVLLCAFIRDISERKAAEKEIRRWNERFLFASKATNDVLWDWNLVTGKVFRGTDGLKKVYGYEDNTSIENIDDWVKQIHPEDKPMIEDMIRQILEPHDRSTFSAEYRFQQPNGEYAYVLDRGYIVRNKEGKAIRMIGAAQDITQRKAAELRIVDSESRYRILFEQNLAGIYQTGVDGRVLNCNKAFALMLGYDSVEDLLHTNAKAFYFADIDREVFISQLRENTRLANYEVILKRKDGGKLHALENISLTIDAKTGEEICYGVLIDITEKKKIEADLQNSYEEVLANELLLKTAEKIAHLGSWHRDMQKGIIKWSDELYNIYGYDTKEVTPSFETFVQHVHPDDTDYVKAKLYESADMQELDFRIIDKTGVTKYIRAEHTVERDDTGKPVKWNGFNMDVTERYRLEQKLAEERTKKQQEITEAIITAQEQERTQLGEELHDNINQILATARLYIECAIQNNQKMNLLAESKEFVTMAIEEIRKLSKTLIAPTLGHTLLKEVVTDMLDNIRQVNKLEFITIWEDMDEQLMDDKLKLAIFRILQEQINNIIKYAKATTVTISITKTLSSLNISVKDDGIGFDTNKKRKGVGLQNIISRTEICSGTVTIHSKPGEGCELLLVFPINAACR